MGFLFIDKELQMNKKSCLVPLVMFFVVFVSSAVFAIPEVPTIPDHKAHWDGDGLWKWEEFNGEPSEATWGPCPDNDSKTALIMNNNEDDTRDKFVWIYMEKSGNPEIEINDSWAWDSENHYDYNITKIFDGDSGFNWVPSGNLSDWHLWVYGICPQPYKEAFKFHVVGFGYDPGFVPSSDLWIYTSCPGGPAPVPEPLTIILLVSTLCGLLLKKRS